MYVVQLPDSISLAIVGPSMQEIYHPTRLVKESGLWHRLLKATPYWPASIIDTMLASASNTTPQLPYTELRRHQSVNIVK